jgi:hypothetical protein
MSSMSARNSPRFVKSKSVRERQRSQDHGVDDREDRGVCADTERESEDGDGGEAWIFTEGADGEAEILEEIVQPGPRPWIARDALHQGDIAKFSARSAGSFFGRGAAVDQVARGEFEVRVEFFVELLFASFSRPGKFHGLVLLDRETRSIPPLHAAGEFPRMSFIRGAVPPSDRRA